MDEVTYERGREVLYIRCVYICLPTVQVFLLWIVVMRGLKKMTFREKGKVVVVGMFGENTCNASGNRLLSFLNEVELMICNGRKLVSEPEWTKIRPSLKQKSIIYYIIADAQLLEVSGNVHVAGTDIGSSDHFLIWMELCRASKTSKKRKCVIRR